MATTTKKKGTIFNTFSATKKMK